MGYPIDLKLKNRPLFTLSVRPPIFTFHLFPMTMRTPIPLPAAATLHPGDNGLDRLTVHLPLATAEIHLHGAHVSAYELSGEPPILFMSNLSNFAAGKPIRGGVPLIFPWFGAKAGDATAPMHGFARTSLWELESVQEEGDVVTVILRLDSNAQTLALWPHQFVLRHRIRISTQLEMTLEVENRSDSSFEFEEAQHTYFQVGDVREVTVTGLAQATFIDKTDHLTLKMQDPAPIRITGETDRVYLHTRATCLLEDPVLGRKIRVQKEHSDTTVVWNPWIAKAKAMADFGDAEWPQMLCIETANAGENAITLAPGGRHCMHTIISSSHSHSSP